MKRTIFLPVLFFLPVMLLVGGCSVNRPASGPNNFSSQQPAPASQNNAPPSQVPAPNNNLANGTAITIQNFAFSPANLTIKRGETVTWTNQDSAPHQIASDTNSFEGPSMSKGQTYSFTFNDVGTFSYHCAIHPSMKGSVTVQ